MFRLSPGEALTLARLAMAAGCQSAAFQLSSTLPNRTKAADPGPRALVVLAGLMLEEDRAQPAAALLRRVLPATEADPYLGEVVARLAWRAGDEALAEAAIAPARAVRQRATGLQDVDEDGLRAATRGWLNEVGEGPGRAYALAELARAWHRLDRLDAAVALARRSIVLDPDYPRARTTLSKIEAERGCHAAAAEALRATDDPDIEIERARLLARAGDVEAGRRALAPLIAGRGAEDWSPESLWTAAEACRLLALDAGPVRAQLERLCAEDASAAMRVLEHVAQSSGGDHRAVNIKDGLQRLLRRQGADALQPETYLLPDEALAAGARLRRSPDEPWILKPARMFGGKGARLITGAAVDGAVPEVSGAWVLQRYVAAPRLIDGHKAHLRCYLLIVPGPPRTVHVSLDGIVRLAPRPWADGSGGEVERHITNTNLHWRTGELEIEADEARETRGHVRRLAAVLDSMGGGVAGALRSFAAEVVDAVQGALQSPLVGLVALDLILDTAGRFHLLEIESRPQFVAGGVPVVGRIHRALGAEAWPILAACLDGRPPPDASGAWTRL